MAAARLLERGARVRRQIADRVLLNYGVLRSLARAIPRAACCRRGRLVGGGAGARARAPTRSARSRWSRETGVLVHPGYFFDFDRDGYFVVSLLVADRTEFRAGASRMLDTIDAADRPMTRTMTHGPDAPASCCRSSRCRPPRAGASARSAISRR